MKKDAKACRHKEVFAQVAPKDKKEWLTCIDCGAEVQARNSEEERLLQMAKEYFNEE